MALQQLHPVTASSVVLEPAFRLWPIESLREIGGWVCGTYAELETRPHQELLEQGRLKRRRQKRGTMRSVTEAQVEASFLQHEALGSALDTERVLRETFEFYEQAYCEPTALVSRERAESALLRFMELPQDDTDKAMEYIKEFGEFSSIEADENGNLNADVPNEIRDYWENCNDRKRGEVRKSPYILDLEEFWEVRKNIQALWDLNTALLNENAEPARQLCVRLRPEFPFHDKTNWLAVGQAILCADLSSSLNPGRYNPRLILYARDGKLVLQTMCMNVRATLYLLLLESVLSGTGYRRCANKTCGMYFMVVRGKEYHSKKCQNAAKVRSWRERQKQRRISQFGGFDKRAVPVR
jgi:hypothetical protein